VWGDDAIQMYIVKSLCVKLKTSVHGKKYNYM